MDFVKKHYEKILLAAVLVALIVSAIVLALRASALSSQLGEVLNIRRKPELIPHVKLEQYTEAQKTIEQPPQWSTNQPLRMFSEKAPVTKVETNLNIDPTKTNAPIIIVKIGSRPFKLLFKNYSFDAEKGQAYNFQINFQFRRSYFVFAVGDAIKDRFGDTGYTLTKFERKFVEVDDATLGKKRSNDVSEVTVTVERTGEGQKQAVLVLGRETQEQELVATYRCDIRGPDKDIRQGQLFDCNRKTYKVVDIKPGQMVIVDTQTGEQYPIDLATTSEPQQPK